MPLRILNGTRGKMIADRVDIANTDSKRRRGLLDRAYLRHGEGLWIVPCHSITTEGMKFPIDVLFVDHAGHVVEVYRQLQPGAALVMSNGAYSVLELAPGRIGATGTEVGDRLVFQKS
jgi:uncharacterized membrane protein (UPF0127 family)